MMPLLTYEGPIIHFRKGTAKFQQPCAPHYGLGSSLPWPPPLPSFLPSGCKAARKLQQPPLAWRIPSLLTTAAGFLRTSPGFSAFGGGVSDSRFDVALPKTRIAVEGFHWPGRTMQRLYGICQFGPNLKPLTEAGYALSRARLAV